MNGKTTGGSTQTELVDIVWVARRLGVEVRHVRRLVFDRRIPFVKWGHLLRFDPARDRSVDRRVTPAAGELTGTRRSPATAGVRYVRGGVDDR